eukprot:TRINITY_DN7569_c0_g1_i2.p1 TRINITY_DN7569_c0_g1~~TRINITY_DN7569_c0_g1_i2.p1  ORF type:complete len:390 (-),score=65.85 TRINITY_DN7569_c0_g1_i2:61-1179(-)
MSSEDVYDPECSLENPRQVFLRKHIAPQQFLGMRSINGEPAQVVVEPFVEIPLRFRSASLMIFGAFSCCLAFVFILVIGMIEFFVVKKNTFGVDYASGLGYFPSTVSEMVHVADSPAGKVFFTFGLISGGCLLVSFYPFMMRNVYTGYETVSIFPVYWTTVRHIVVPMGIWLLIGVNTYPLPVAKASPGGTMYFCCFLHLCGAGMMFVGYMLCEMKCMALCCFSHVSTIDNLFLSIEGRERSVRRCLAITCAVGFVLFVFSQFAIAAAGSAGNDVICCSDKWVMPGTIYVTPDGKEREIGSPTVVDTASGLYLGLKLISFFTEVIAGLAIVFSHLAVWHYCEERHADVGLAPLEKVYDDATSGSDVDSPYES